MSHADTDLLLRCVRRKHDCLVQLRELGAQQCSVVDGGEVGDLLRLLGAKQQLITHLQEIEQELLPFRQDDPDARVWRDPAERVACRRLLGTCEELFRAILEDERLAEETLRARRDESLRRLSASRAADAARGAYAPQMDYQSGALDLTSEV